MELKKLLEEWNSKKAQLRALVETAQAETRALTEEENTTFDTLEAEAAALEATVQRAKRIGEDYKLDEGDPDAGSESEEADIRAFAAYIRNEISERADQNLTKGDNGAVIPKTIANMIIKQVKDICPIYAAATKFNVKGLLAIPYYDETNGRITMAYANEFTELESKSGKFTSIELTGYLAGALTKVSKSLANNSDFDLVQFVVNAMAESIALFIEHELLIGTTGKSEGLKGVKIVVTASAQTAFTTDELIDLKDSVKDAFQAGAMWIMNSATRTAARKLKDGNGRYLLQDDLTSPFGSVLLGKPVYVSDQMPGMAAGAISVYYGDFSGLAVKLVEEAEIQVLHEHYATQHAIGVVAWMEFDSKVMDAQKIAALKMGA